MKLRTCATDVHVCPNIPIQYIKYTIYSIQCILYTNKFVIHSFDELRIDGYKDITEKPTAKKKWSNTNIFPVNWLKWYLSMINRVNCVNDHLPMTFSVEILISHKSQHIHLIDPHKSIYAYNIQPVRQNNVMEHHLWWIIEASTWIWSHKLTTTSNT